MKKIRICFHVFFKSLGFVLSNCLNATKIHSEYVWIAQFFSYIFKSCIGFMLSNYVNEKNTYMFSCIFQKLYWFRAIKLFECHKNTFGIWNTQYSITLSVHKQPSVFNITHTIHSRVNCPNFIIWFLKVVLVSCYQIVWMKKNTYTIRCISFMLSNCLNAKKIYLEYEIHNTA